MRLVPLLTGWIKNGLPHSECYHQAHKSVKLKKKLTDMECTISMMKQERINHRQQMKARDKKQLACVVVVVALAMLYALFAMMIRVFV